MLENLKIHNLALMDCLDIDFHEGFSALTGETGAGKSILLESIGFVLGERSSKEIIRTGEAKASVEAKFSLKTGSPAAIWLQEHDLFDEESLIIYRELSASGRTSARINGTLVSAAELKELGDLLVDFHGQHAHQALLDERTHLSVVDSFLPDESLKTEMLRLRNETALKRKQLRELQEQRAAQEKRLLEIQTEIEEIDRVNPRIGEEEQLEADRKIARNSSFIEEKLTSAYDALNREQGILSSIYKVRSDLEALSGLDAQYDRRTQDVQSAYYTLEDVAFALRDALSQVSFLPSSLDDIENRLFTLEELKRKYGKTVGDILDYRKQIAAEREMLLSVESVAASVEAEEQAAFSRFKAAAQALSDARRNISEKLAGMVKLHLQSMGMPNAGFAADFQPVSAETLSENGLDNVVFLFSANKGEPLKSLAKTASGGEISRVMLALKAVLATADTVETLIFDEIDTGISGMIANTVAKEMRLLSRSHQILCITHLPQIAAHANRQYYIYKTESDDSTVSRAKLLSDEERPQELARIMGGTEQATAIAHARDLLSAAQKEEELH